MTPREFIDLHWAAPQIEVIDRAIEMIESGYSIYCCHALRDALNGQARGGIAPWPVIYLYQRQFRDFCRSRSGGSVPGWWNFHRSKARQRLRLAALRAFRAACIEAGGAA